MTDYLIPMILLLASALSLGKKENSYSLLLEGGAEGLRLLKGALLPSPLKEVEKEIDQKQHDDLIDNKQDVAHEIALESHIGCRAVERHQLVEHNAGPRPRVLGAAAVTTVDGEDHQQRIRANLRTDRKSDGGKKHDGSRSGSQQSHNKGNHKKYPGKYFNIFSVTV